MDASRRPRWETWALLFDTHPTCTRALSFDTEAPITAAPVFNLPGVPEASSPHPSFQSSDGFFWSSASVEDATGVRPCRLEGKIVGLLFSYLDGSSAAIGQLELKCWPRSRTVLSRTSKTAWTCGLKSPGASQSNGGTLTDSVRSGKTVAKAWI
ncbi:hypothetical protein FALCPG4_008704 [Fusarium falciforme]